MCVWERKKTGRKINKTKGKQKEYSRQELVCVYVLELVVQPVFPLFDLFPTFAHISPPASGHPALFVANTLQDLKNVHKDVDYVHVQRDRRHDIFFG